MSNITPEQQIRNRLAKVLAELRSAIDAYESQLMDPNGTRASLEKAQRLTSRLEAERTRLAEELKLAQLQSAEGIGGTFKGMGRQRPMRELVIDMLGEIAVPSLPRTVSDYAKACQGVELQAARFASLRRDESRAFDRDPNSRPVWVVPALNLFGLTPIPRLVALSVWEPERRIIGPRTSRVNHLRALLAFVRRRELLSDTEGSSAGLDAMIFSYARNVPGAIALGAGVELERVKQAANSELELIEDEDRSERLEAAKRLLKFPADRQIWGLPAVIDGDAAFKRGGIG